MRICIYKYVLSMYTMPVQIRTGLFSKASMKSFFICLLCLLMNHLLSAQERDYPPISDQELRYVIVSDTSQVTQVLTQNKHQDQAYQAMLYNILFDQQKMQKLLRERGLHYPLFPRQATLLTTLSVLPGREIGSQKVKQKKLIRKITWKKVELDTLTDHLLTLDSLMLMAAKNVNSYYMDSISAFAGLKCGKLITTKIIPIIQRGKSYYRTDNDVLTEFRPIIDQSTNSPVPTDKASLNLSAQPFSRAQERAQIQREGHAKLMENWAAHNDNIFLEKRYTENGHTLYQFWAGPPGAFDVSWPCYGTEDFVFLPGVGIIAGSYPAYFTQYGNVKEKFIFDNPLFKTTSVNGKSWQRFK